MSLIRDESAKILMGSSFGSIDEEVFVRKDIEGQAILEREKKGRHIDSYKAYHCTKEAFRNSISDHEGATLYRWIDNWNFAQIMLI